MATKGSQNMYEVFDVRNSHISYALVFSLSYWQMFNFAFGELYPGGKHHLRQCDRLSVRLFRSGRDGERKCCSVPCNANSVTAFSLLYHPQYALVTSNVTWQLYAAVDLVCAMYLLVYRRFWFRSRLVYPDEFVLSECAGWLLSLHSARFPAVDEPPFATITSTLPRRMPLTSGLQPAPKWQCDLLLFQFPPSFS